MTGRARGPGNGSADLTLWPPARRGVAAAAVLTAFLTAVVTALVSDPGVATVLGGLHVGLTVIAVVQPLAVIGQVGVGVALAATPLTGAEGTAWGVVPLVVGVVVVAELLGLSAQLGVVVPRHPGEGLGRVALAAAVAAGASGTTVALGSLDGPAGLVATALAATAGLAYTVVVLHGRPHPGDGPDPTQSPGADVGHHGARHGDG